MVKPATARRRNKVYQQQLAQQQAAAAAAQQHQHEEEVGGMHDEADVMSFRVAATQRFILNQEWIENVTDRWIHVDKILKPKPFPKFQTEKKSINEIKNEVYFGNLDLMKQKVELLEKEVQDLEKLDNEEIPTSEIQKLTSKLASSYQQNESTDLEAIAKKFTEITKKRVVDNKYNIRSIPELRIDHSQAPQDYWEELAKKKELQNSNTTTTATDNNGTDLVMGETTTALQDLPEVTAGVQDHLNYVPTGFENEDLNMIDDVGFGLHSTLDDQDFLSQIDHSME